MGILNITPDSFSDGNKFIDPEKALDHALRLQADGAEIIDVGAESTRPGAIPITETEELNRILPVMEKLGKSKHFRSLISIDTYKPKVAKECLAAGAWMINDVSGLENPSMRNVIAEYKCRAVIMHAHAITNLSDLREYFLHQVLLAEESGIEKKKCYLDPGFGFSKTPEQNWEILNSISEWRLPYHGVLIGTSRKSFSDGSKSYITKETVKIGIEKGANVIRVHDLSVCLF